MADSKYLDGVITDDEEQIDEPDEQPERTNEHPEDGTPDYEAMFKESEKKLKQAERDGKRARDELKRTQRGEEQDVDAAREEFAAQVREQMKARIVHAEARALFREKNVTGNMNRLVNLIKLDDVDLTDDGVDGLDDQIDDIIADFPTLVGGQPRPKGDPRLRNDASPKPPVRHQKSNDEQIADQLRGIRT